MTRPKVFAATLATVTSITLAPAGLAHADDNDDNKNSSSSRPSSSVEMWPPTAVQWPPLRPAEKSGTDDAPVIPIP